MSKKELITSYVSIHPWMLVDFHELNRKQIEKDLADYRKREDLPARETDKAGQAGLDESEHT